MSRIPRFSLISLLVYALPLVQARLSQNPFSIPSYDASWADPPRPNTTSHHIFNSLSSLLQLWPNTMWPGGHSIVPATIPPGTTLYHGTSESNITAPSSPDWLAFDPEHSYVFCRSSCRIFTFLTTRPLRLLYLDGSSASKGPGNITSVETQDLLTWGELRPDQEWDEFGRIAKLCEWGKPFGLDGFVRMEFDFEVMYCDFSTGLQTTASHHPLPRINDPTDPRYDVLPNSPSTHLQAMIAGAWHHRYPGEARVQLDVSGLVTFYDPALSSLLDLRVGVPRMRHQLAGISRGDITYKLKELQDVLTRETTQGSGIDWRTIARIVVERYAPRLAQLNDTLAAEPDLTMKQRFANASAQALAVRAQLLVMLTPYLTPHDVPGDAHDSSAQWVAPVVARCASSIVGHILDNILTPQERILRTAVSETLHEICRRLGLMWADAVTVMDANIDKSKRLLEQWRIDIIELMSWLEWSVWHTCRPLCASDELCYLPTWPFFITGDDDPSDKTPRCVKIDPSVIDYSLIL